MTQVEKLAHDRETEDLAHHLAVLEDELEARVGHGIDTLVDPASGKPVVLRHAWTELYESEERLRLLLEQVPAVLWTTDRDLVCTSAMGLDLAAIGLSAEQMVGMTVSEIARGNPHATRLVDAHRLALQGQWAAIEGEWAGYAFQAWIKPLHDREGNIRGCLGVGLDINEQVRMERELRAAHDELEQRVQERTAELAAAYEELMVHQEELRLQEDELRQQNQALVAAGQEAEVERRRYQELFDLAPDGYLVTDELGVIHEANLAAARMLGALPEYLIGQPLAVYVPDPDKRAFREQLAHLQRDEVREVRDWDIRLQPRARAPMDVSITITPVQGPTGRTTGLRWLIRDISERKRLAEDRERLLAQSIRDREIAQGLAAVVENERDLLQTIMEHTHAQIAYLDREFRYQRVNAAYARGSDYSVEALLGHYHFDLFPNEENEAIFRQVRDSGKTASFQARPFTFPDRPELGTTYWDWTLAPVKDARGEVQGLVYSLLDVTERERARRDREQHLARLDTLVRVSQDVLAETTVDGLLGQVVEAACELTGAWIGAAGQTGLDGVFRTEPDVHQKKEQPPGEAAAQSVQRLFRDALARQQSELFKTRGSLRLTVEEQRRHPAWTQLLEGHPPLRGLLAAQLTGRKGEPNGVIWVSDKEKGEFTAEDEALLSQLAALTSLALQHIEARNEAEQRANEMDAMFEAMLNPLIIFDAQGRPVRANLAAEELFGAGLVGRDRKELRRVFQIRRPDGSPVRLEELPSSRALRGELVQESGLRLRTAEGVKRALLVSAAPLRSDGAVTGAVTVWHDVTERKQAEDALRESEQRLRWALQGARGGAWDWDLRSGEAWWSQEMYELWGVEPGTRMWLDNSLALVHEQDRERLRAAVEESVAQHTDYRYEFRIHHPVRGERWMASYGRPVYDESGRALRLLGISLDITERKQAEEAQRQYAERLRILHEADEAILSSQSAKEVAQAVLQRLPHLVPCQRADVVLFDMEDREVSMLASYSATGAKPDGEQPLAVGEMWETQGWEQMFDQLASGEELIIDDLQALLFESPLIRELQAEEIRAVIVKPLLVQGRLISILTVGMQAPGPLPAEQVEVVRELADPLAIGIEQARLHEEVQHYTEDLEQLVRQRTAQLSDRTAALEASEARFRTVFEEAAIGIILLDREGRIVSSNPALQEMVGYDQGELEGMPCADLLAPDEERESLRLFRELMAGQRDEYALEQRLRRRDGGMLEANVTASLIRRGQGEDRLAIALVEDITERRRAQEALIQSERLAITGRLAASMAHEVNNPLQSVTGSLELVNELLDVGEDPRPFMQVALEELERASRIVHQMRDLSRRTEAQKEPTDVNELVQKVLLLTQKQAQTHNVETAWEPAEELPSVPIVRDRVQQVFLNIVLNAVDAMPDGGELRITIGRMDEPRGVQVSFTDTGVGISPELMEHLFEPFRSTKTQGLGLGLYVSRNIVREHGGWIDVQSEVGRGTTFTVWLPAESE